jgi:PAS domain S-box-containing protein
MTSDGMLVASTIHEIDAVSQSEAYFRTLLESAPDAMIIVDDAGKIAIVNAQAERMFGYDREELLGKAIELLLPDHMRDTHVTHRDTFARKPSVRTMGRGLDLVARRKDGSEFPVEISLSPVGSAQGNFVSSVIRDVTERKRMEEDIVAAQQAAERANKANSAFLAAASHDLRQPVQALNLLNGALRRMVTDPRVLEIVESQYHSLMAMTNLLNSLLDISRLDAGAISPDFEVFPVQRLIDRLSAEFARQARQKGLEFRSLNCNATVRSDPNLLSEIIQNFVSNAVRYTNKGNVRLSCNQEDGQCRINVVDTGTGIEADQLDSIFQEFHQCNSSTSSKEGFGLGLAIVRRLSDLLGHGIEVQSEPGKGSCFSVSVPIVRQSQKPVEEESGDAPAHATGSGLIVLIEDDVNVTNAWEMLLEAEGYSVATAASARAARALIKRLDVLPALLISDFHLADGSTGVEAVVEIRRYYDENIPAFIVSGDTSKVVRDARSVENCTLMSKPVNTARLLNAAQFATRTGHVLQD